MKLEFYRTVLCPRCLYTGLELKKISTEFPEIKIESIEVTLNLRRTIAAAIHTVPAIKIGNEVMTGFILTPTKIRQFIRKQLTNKQ